MRILLTGHNGFKGTWFTLLLTKLGHKVDGISLPSERGHLSNRIQVERLLGHEVHGDIRHKGVIETAIQQKTYDLVIHFAAQSLVRESYRKPLWTFETNVNGTLNLLETLTKLTPETQILIITTDKVYRNDGRTNGYTENDPLGGDDPYSTSKAMADLLTQSWQTVHPNLRIGIARAGNVIGGGDSCKERLMPDLISAFSNSHSPLLRNPQAIRPWQHVLDCLNGYIRMMEKLGEASGSIGAWNIGPDSSSVRTVSEVAERVAKEFESKIPWQDTSDGGIKEAQVLLLDSSKANRELRWWNKLSFEDTINWTVRWEKKVIDGIQPLKSMEQDIEEFLLIRNPGKNDELY